MQGAGQQRQGALINLVAYYICGLPLAVLLSFRLGFDVNGLVLGMVLGTTIQAVWYTTMVLRLDWEEQARAAAARVARQVADIVATDAPSTNGTTELDHSSEDELPVGDPIPSEAVYTRRLERVSSVSLDLPRASYG